MDPGLVYLGYAIYDRAMMNYIANLIIVATCGYP